MRKPLRGRYDNEVLIYDGVRCVWDAYIEQWVDPKGEIVKVEVS